MDNHDNPILLANLKQRIESTTQLPVMPEIARALLRLNSDPNANGKELTAIAETDPSLTAQILRYARSAFFGYQGQITSLHQAITSVLGFNMTLDIALGLSLGKSFNIPRSGPLGLDQFWRHSVYSAAYIERLINVMPRQHRPHPGLGFLCGLLHNFGVLLVAHLFRKEAGMLQQVIIANSNTPVVDLERQVMGTDHMEIGAWLIRSWNLQAEIEVAVAEHHNASYRGVHAAYPRLCLVADRLLKRHGLGDGDTTEVPEEVFESLGITAEDAEQVLELIMTGASELNVLAEQFAA